MTRIFRDGGHSADHFAGRDGTIPPRHRPSAPTTTAVLLGAAVLALTGCAGGSSGTGGPSSPVASPTFSSAPSVSPALACPESESQGPWGTVVAAAQVTDAAGSYCHTTVDPAAAAFDASVVDLDSLASHDFTLEDAQAAQQLALVYVAEQGLDSTRLDSTHLADDSTTDSAWFEAEKAAFTPAAQARFAAMVASAGLRDSGVIVGESLPSPLTRDGGPRAISTELNVDKIFATLDLDQVTPLLVVRVPFIATYRVTDAVIVDTAIRNERGTENLTEETLRVSTPSLFDGSDDEGLLLTGSFNVGFGSEEPSAIAYVGTAWTLTTGDGALQVDAVEPELDPSQR